MDRYSCSPRGNSWRHTYTVCSGAGVLSNRTECLDPGESETPDAARYPYQACSGNSLATRYACSRRADGEGVAACGVEFRMDGSVIANDINSADWELEANIGTWASAPSGINIATDVAPFVTFEVTQLGRARIAGSSTFCSGGTGGAVCRHFGGGWTGGGRGTPGGSFRITIRKTSDNTSLAAGTVGLSGGGAVAPDPLF